MSWSIRQASLEDAARVEAFLLTIPEFDGTIEVGQERQTWRWLFSSDAGLDGAYVAEDGSGSVVGHYGSAPWPFWADGQMVTAGLLCKLAIDPRYRRTPLFMRLSLQVLRASFAGGGPSFSFGVVNRPEVMPFHFAFGLERIGELPVYAKPLRLERVARSMLSSRTYRWARVPSLVAGGLGRFGLLLLARRPSNGIRISRISAFGPEFDGVDAFLKPYKYRSARSAASLTRRYLSQPARGYAPYRVDGPGGLAGYFVLRRMRMMGFDALALVDVCLDPAVAAAPGVILRFVDRAAIDSGVDLVSALAGAPGLRRMLRRALYVKTPESFTLIVHAPRPQAGEADKPPKPGVVGSMVSDWYLTWHDSDYV